MISNDQIREGYEPRYFEDEDYPALRFFPHSELKRNRLHLRMLAIGYYLLAVFFGAVGLGGGILLALLGTAPTGPPGDARRYIFFGIVAFLFVFYGSLSLALIVAGRSLAVHKRYVFCLVMAWFLMFNGAFGILLGILTIVVLLRDSVKELFKRGDLAFEVDADHD